MSRMPFSGVGNRPHVKTRESLLLTPTEKRAVGTGTNQIGEFGTHMETVKGLVTLAQILRHL